MEEIQYSDLDNKVPVLTDISPFEETGAPTGTERQKTSTKQQDKDLYLAGIKSGSEPLNPRSFIAGRFDSHEPIKSTALVAGTYTIAQSEQIADNVAGCTLRIVSESGIDLVEVDFKESGSAKTHQNTKVELLNANFGKVRFITSNTVNGAGSKIEITTDITTDLIVQLFSNSGTNKGFELIAPIITNNLPPDGSAATFLKAGEELQSINSITLCDNRFVCFAATATSLRVALFFDEIPKQATTITFPVAFNLQEPDGTLVYAVSPGETVSVNDIVGNVVTGVITTIGLATQKTGFGVGASFSAKLS